MLFNSLEFVLFFICVAVLFYILPHRFRWGMLLIGSYYFYACWNPEYLALIIFTTLVTYTTGRLIGQENASKRYKKTFLVVSLLTNFSVLFTFKYFDFFNGALRRVVTSWGVTYPIPDLDLLLPVGISFYTFQALSYTIDVYRGTKTPERHLGLFALYVSFFPQLVAGPIERSTRLLPQFYKKRYPAPNHHA